MTRAFVASLALVLALDGTAQAERVPWYRGFYTRVGVRDSYAAEERFHAWAAFAFGFGHRYTREAWGIDASVLNFQFDPEEGLHTVVRAIGYVNLGRWTRIDSWLGGGVSYGWLKGTVDQPIPKRRGEGMQGELAFGIELPREMRVRLFTQLTATLPFYYLYDTTYHARDSALYVYALEVALGVRF